MYRKDIYQAEYSNTKMYIMFVSMFCVPQTALTVQEDTGSAVLDLPEGEVSYIDTFILLSFTFSPLPPLSGTYLVGALLAFHKIEQAYLDC